MTGFSIDWLDLREGADQRAREHTLLEQAQLWLRTESGQRTDNTIVDLGAGTGSTLRAFDIAATPTAQITEQKSPSWRLVDQDPALLEEAKTRHGVSHQLKTYELNLTDIAALPLQGAKLVTASALFDLVSSNFIDSFVAALQSQCQQQPLGFYGALNYDGTTHWTPAHPLDEVVLSAFNRDQQRDKGFGLALGPDAGPYMEQVFKSSGFRVLSANSPWVLGEAETKLVNALISGIAEAVLNDPALDTKSLEDWVQFRKANAATGTCVVGHTDLLALPNVRKN
jgi:hypothetical protein